MNDPYPKSPRSYEGAMVARAALGHVDDNVRRELNQPLRPHRMARVRIKSLTGDWFADGRIVPIGGVCEMDLDLAQGLERFGRAERV
jgi:hypothetical protein